MNEHELLKRSHEALKRAHSRPATEQFQRLVDKGIINEEGQVQFSDVRLAVIAVSLDPSGQRIDHARCFKVASLSQHEVEEDVSRDDLVKSVTDNGRVITAYLDTEHNCWREGDAIRVTRDGYLRTDEADIQQDDLGGLPSADHRIGAATTEDLLALGPPKSSEADKSLSAETGSGTSLVYLLALDSDGVRCTIWKKKDGTMLLFPPNEHTPQHMTIDGQQWNLSRDEAYGGFVIEGTTSSELEGLLQRDPDLYEHSIEIEWDDSE